MKRILKVLLVVLILSIVFVVYTQYPRLNIVTGYSAKSVASGVFLANRTQESVELGDNDFDPVTQTNNKVNLEDKSVTSTLYGLKKRKSVFIDGVGAILVDDDFDQSNFLVPNRDRSKIEKPYPFGNLPEKDTMLDVVDYQKLQVAIDNAFDLPGKKEKRTRAIVVLYKGFLIGEKYDEGFNQNTPILGWSMTKSITSTIYGILQKQGKINILDEVPLTQWKNDDRKKITYNDLLQMNSGLEWLEDYNQISDVTKMLFLDKNMGDVQMNKNLIGEPNESWNYSSGTTNLLAGRLLRNQFNSHQEYLDFWYEELIDKIGMHSAIIETDMEGNYVGSSYGWATPRDWAKFGQLYLSKGNWNGEQIIDSSFVDYVSTPTNGSDKTYGGQFWLNANGKVYPDVPSDLFSANGYQGQMVAIIPSKDMVIVRMGLKENPEFDFNKMLSEIIESVDN